MGGANKKMQKNEATERDTKKRKKEEEVKEPEDSPSKKQVLQTGGHANGFLHMEDGKIAKKVSEKEYHFYTVTLKKYSQFKCYVPEFFGTDQREDKKYVIIQDLTYGFKKPCMMDIKIGTSSVGEDASPEKKASMASKDAATTTVTLGLRLIGMRVYQVDKDEFLSHDKPWGKAVKDDNFAESLSIFFSNGKELNKNLVELFLALVKTLYQFFQSQTDLRFYSSSLLFIYDGKQDPDSQPEVRLKMIDFAHVHPIQDNRKDEGYIFGLKNLIEQLEKVKAL